MCESSDLQLLLQFELAYVEDSGPLFQCTCDPQDTFTKEARRELEAEGTDIDPAPEPTYFGETCDYHCLKPPWEGSDECNGLGIGVVYQFAIQMVKNLNVLTMKIVNLRTLHVYYPAMSIGIVKRVLL